MSPLFLTALLATLQSGAPAPAWRTPVGKWTVEYAENMCTLARSYGTKDEPLILGFKPSPMSDSLQLVLMKAGRGTPAYVKSKVMVNDATPLEQQALAFNSPSTRMRVALIDLKRSDLEPLVKQGRLSVEIGRDAAVNLSVLQFDLALRGLQACERNLLQHWGMSEAAQAAVVVKPQSIRPIHTYIKSDDYPSDAVRNHEQGASGVRFWVGLDGKPIDCKVIESSGSSLLDETTCRVITARVCFNPAVSGDGRPVRSLSFTRIKWILPYS